MADKDENTQAMILDPATGNRVSSVKFNDPKTSSIPVVANNPDETLDGSKEPDEFIANFENGFVSGTDTDTLKVSRTDIENTDFREEAVTAGEMFPFDHAAATHAAANNVFGDVQKNFSIVAIGSELVSGYGDPRALGCLGRITARTLEHPFFKDEQATLHVFPLATHNETVESLNDHWEDEAERRFSAFDDDESMNPHDNRLVIFLPNRDALEIETTTRIRLTFANILDSAIEAGYNPFVVGPFPSLDPNLNSIVAELNSGYADASSRRDVPYVNTFSPLLSHGQWQKDLASNNGVPGQAGHGLIAWLVLHRGWFEWLGLEEPAF